MGHGHSHGGGGHGHSHGGGGHSKKAKHNHEPHHSPLNTPKSDMEIDVSNKPKEVSFYILVTTILKVTKYQGVDLQSSSV